MSAPILALALCFAGVFCLTPLSVYLLWLAGVNRRPLPTVVSGSSDFIALIAGLSGFLIFGGLLTVTALQSNARYWTRGNFEQLRTAFDQEKWIWLAIAGGYIAVVVFAVAFGMRRRRKSLAIYGVDIDGLVAKVFSSLAPILDGVKYRGSPSAYGHLYRIEPFYGMGHAVVRITANDRSESEEIERILRAELPQSPPAARSPAGWFHAVAVCCAIGALFSLGLVFFYIYLGIR